MNKKHLIIVVLLIIVLFLIIGIAFTIMSTTTAYENFTCNDTGTTFEVPVGLKVRQDQENYGIRYSVMSTPDGDIVIQRSLGDNPYMGEGMSGASDLINSYNGDKVNGVELHTCSRTVKNEATGEVIMVTSNRGDNETVEHIINSIRWGNKTGNLTEGSSSISPISSSNNGSNNHAKYTDEDLELAKSLGYNNGYSDGVDDSNYYGSSNVITTTDSSGGYVVNGSLE